MKPTPKNTWIVFLLTPVVAAGIMAGLWIAGAAAYENLRMGWATSQIIRIALTAREVAIDPAMTPERATHGLLKRLSQTDSIHANAEDAKSWPFLLNPWKERLVVVVQPAQKQVALSTHITSAACKRLLLFFAKDIPALGVKTIVVQSADPASNKAVTLYKAEDKAANAAPEQASIHAACGLGGEIALGLTFAL